MVDTGAAPSLIKIRQIRDGTAINRKDTIRLSGITDGFVTTLGTVNAEIGGHPVTFQAVSDDFPIAQDGILGADFLRDAAAINFIDQTISWRGIIFPFAQRETIHIPARSSAVIHVKVLNPEVEIGYIPRIITNQGIYLGDAVVTNRDGKAFIRAFNTRSEEASLTIPLIKLEEIESLSPKPETGAPIESRSNENTPHPAVGAMNDLDPTQTRQVGAINQQEPDRAADVLNLLRLDHLNKEESEYVRNTIAKHSDLFHLPSDKLGYTNVTKHNINTTDEQPVHTKQYRFPPMHKDEIDKQVKQLLENDTIKPSASPYNSPLWIVPKKADSKGNKRWRMVIDYRMLNEKTIGDAYPLPNITEILDQLGSAKYFSVFDLASGFHQILVDERDAPKTAFSTPYGHYEFKRMPFGLKSAPATFQRLMDSVLTGLQGTELFVYLDDIVLYASSLREHEIKFDKLAAKLRKANLKLQPDKCEFLRKEVTYLGHIISEGGVKPDPEKIKAVSAFPVPENAKNIKQFLGLTGYYRRFIPNFSKIAKPLTSLLKKEAPFAWTKEQQDAFETLGRLLCSEPILQYPDFSRPFSVTTDASGLAIGGILSQGKVGKDLPIAYTSRLLNTAERNYSTIEKELLAIVYCVNQFRPYLYGRNFQLITDHKPLIWLHSVKDPTSRLVRWRLKLAEYEYEVIYKAGKANENADALSRNPPKGIFPLTTSSSAPGSPSIFDMPVQSETEDSGDTDSDSDETDDEPLFDPVNEPYEIGKAKITEVRDNFLTRNDYLAIFVSQSGEPCDEGSRLLQKEGKLPEIKDATVGRARIIKDKGKRIIALAVKTRASELTEARSVTEALRSLYDVATELCLKTISIVKGNVDNVPWKRVREFLGHRFTESTTKIIICRNEVAIPEPADRTRIIREYHASAVGGHKGVTKTYNRIKNRYHWPKMKAGIQTYIQNCKECQLKKLVRVKPRQPMVLTDTPGTAFEKIAMDVMGPLPTTLTGHSYILTIQDLLTKFSLAIPLKHAAALDIADAFVNDVICIFGAPNGILTDQGSHFINNLIRNIARKFKIAHFHTTAYRPQSNGSIERSHHVLWEYLKQFVDKNSEWDQHLKLATFSYNTSVHESTQYTPHELVFGKIARAPTSDPPLGNSGETYSNYLTNLYNRLRETQEIARDNLMHAKERSKTYYDKKQRTTTYRTGDFVYLLKEPNKNKLGDQYVGPFVISEILPNNNARIALGKDKFRVVHIDKLKLCKSARAPLQSRHKTPTPTPETSRHQGCRRPYQHKTTRRKGKRISVSPAAEPAPR